ncbi:hypothetical protein [Helicobacter cetorum]|uniref:hypothetical protein n=1 Tax=Helicobacter cetorum TaxID=138563 RepID=UPI000CF172D0|nr:hypothetical protein [Helicobacter cetorum]
MINNNKIYNLSIKNLRLLSKNACLVLVGLFAECEAHPKDGFFISVGFESGMSSVSESIQKHPIYSQNIQKPNVPTNQSSSSESNPNKNKEFKDPTQIEISTKPNTNEQKMPKPSQTNPKIETENTSNQEATLQPSKPPQNAPIETPIPKPPSPNNRDKIFSKAKACEERTQNNNQTCAPLIDNLSPKQIFAPSNIKAPTDIPQITANQYQQTDLFTNENVVGKKFSTTNPIATHFDSKNNQIVIENYLPYDLSKVKLVVKVADSNNSQGYRDVELAIFDKIPKSSHITLSQSQISAFNDVVLQNVDTQSFEFRYNGNDNPTDKQEQQTQRVLGALDKITTNIYGTFEMGNGVSWNCNNQACLETPTADMAQNYVNMYLNLASTLDSSEWEQAMLNANFNFHGIDSSQTNHRDIDKQSLVDQFRQDSRDLSVRVVNDVAAYGWANPNAMAVNANIINPNANKILRGYDNENIDETYQYMLHIFFHEFGHTKGWGHDGNLTYNEYMHLGGGFASITTKTWLDLAKNDELPINYKELPENYGGAPTNGFYNVVSHINGNVQVAHNLQNNQVGGNSRNYPSYQYPTHRDPYDDCNPRLYNCASRAMNLNDDSQASMFNYALNTMSSTMLESVQNIQQQTFKNAMLGFNATIGYQKYFNNILGISYYAIFNYNYSKQQGLLDKTQQLGFGGGLDLLIDFINIYSGKSFKSSFGVFIGARGLYNYYKLNGTINTSKNNGNVYATIGFSYRYKHSKISLGVGIPLIKQNIKASITTQDYVGEVVLNEGYNNMHVFMNYGWVF